MRVIHSFGDLKKEGEGEGSFLLADGEGGYLCLSSKSLNTSHYEGWLTFRSGKLYKTIENIRAGEANDGEVNTLHNRFSHIERDSGATTERFFLSKKKKGVLLYEIFNNKKSICIHLDFRGIHDFDDKGRVYNVYSTEGNLLVVHYRKYKDNSLAELDHEHYLSIKNIAGYKLEDKWEYRNYEQESSRKSKSDFYVYGPLVILPKGSKLVFANAETEEESIRKANEVWDSYHEIQKETEKSVLTLPGIPDMESLDHDSCLDLLCAANSLNSLTVNAGRKGIFAGYPWFTQFWARDELISSKAHMMLGNYFLAKDILMHYIREESVFPDNRDLNSDLKSADSPGWLFMRLHELLELLGTKIYDYFSRHELEMIKEKLEKSISCIATCRMQGGLVVNGKLETWMDTARGTDDRSGARIEIQALQIRMYSFAAFMRKLLGENNSKYNNMEKEMRKKAASLFYKNKMLADGKDDFTQRPNIFLAYYIYPALLPAEKWENAFDTALEKLWLDWGGLSSIDKENDLFLDTSTGQDNFSYHRGDSWYYINNIAAICLGKLNPRKYRETTDKIKNAGSKEMLFSGFPGHCAEISSAKHQESRGCRCQAWSASTFIELIKQ